MAIGISVKKQNFEKFEKENNDFGYSSAEFQSVVDEIKKLGNYNDGVELYNKAEKIILNQLAHLK